ncbi:CAAX prenyl protease-like protein [Arcticibacter pallidicorallinus]|uniref:CAAX prenyl protease-like protein n=1 Tax=Arcticibacter pallidicorallinus TaxID=1259464 RepID=A0A2T0U7T8_9SPHI|nr:CPBP family intramembrane glutamic endopeptidase [Arcticibacter pallidicorallinus]PRY53969.1 CAAX prenyl protease-like protein [Arcticibacter pallidicorallinus]
MIASSYLLSALLQFIIILPFLFFGKRKFDRSEYRFLGIFALMFLLWSVLTNGLAPIIVNENQTWNWLGKIAGLLLGVFFVYRNKLISKSDIGWTLRLKKGTVKPIIYTVLMVLIARLIIYFCFERVNPDIDFETLVFQGSLAGFCDELIFRGILLALLNKVFTAKEDIFGYSLSFGVLISSLLYGISQGFILQEGFHLQINLIRILLGFLVGLIAAVLKERSGSLLPAVIFHNLWMLITNH